MTRTIDFDKFRSEQAEEPVVLRLGGRDYELPSSMPAALALDIVRLQASKGPDGEFDEGDIQRLGAALFGGEDRFIQILADGAVTLEEMPELIQQVLQAYGSGAAPVPNREARRQRAKTTSRSSKTGRSSKRTS